MTGRGLRNGQRNPARDRIAGYLAEHGPSRLTVLAAALDMTSGAAGGQLHLMAGDGEVVHRARGVWCLPGQEAAPAPPDPADRSAAASKANRARWAAMTPADRAARVAEQFGRPVRGAARG